MWLSPLPLAAAICAIFLLVALFFAHRGLRLAPVWGALWGACLGFWFVVPQMLNVHHIVGLSLRQWAIVDALFLGIFGVLGAVIGVVVTLPATVVSLIGRRDFRNARWGYAIWTLVWLPVAYLVLSGEIERTNFGRFPPLDAYASAIGVGVGWYLGAIAVLILLYRRRTAHRWDRDGNALAIGLAVLTVAASLAVPLRLDTPPVAATTSDHVASRVVARSTPLLVIGFDGGTWRPLRRLMDLGMAPTFSRLVAEGVHGDVQALWPPYWSTPAWGSILTGYSQEEIGVYEDLSATTKGFPVFELPLTVNLVLNPLFVIELNLISFDVIKPMPTPRTKLNRAPVWERLSRAGVRTAVVRFPFTYPATGQAEYVISNRVVVDMWDRLGVETGDRRELVAPASDADALLAHFSSPPSGESQLIARLLPRLDWPKPADAVIDPIDVLRRVTTVDMQMFEATKDLLRREPGLSAVMLHVTGFDNIAHAYWQYRFPEDFPDDPPAQADIDVLGPVLDRYLQMLDGEIGVLIAAFPSPPNVLVVADHGEGPNRLGRFVLWKGWHSSPGVFVAAGPDIAHAPEALKVSYYDVVPTILALKGFQKPADLRGRVVVGKH